MRRPPIIPLRAPANPSHQVLRGPATSFPDNPLAKDPFDLELFLPVDERRCGMIWSRSGEEIIFGVRCKLKLSNGDDGADLRGVR